MVTIMQSNKKIRDIKSEKIGKLIKNTQLFIKYFRTEKIKINKIKAQIRIGKELSVD